MCPRHPEALQLFKHCPAAGTRDPTGRCRVHLTSLPPSWLTAGSLQHYLLLPFWGAAQQAREHRPDPGLTCTPARARGQPPCLPRRAANLPDGGAKAPKRPPPACPSVQGFTPQGTEEGASRGLPRGPGQTTPSPSSFLFR